MSRAHSKLLSTQKKISNFELIKGFYPALVVKKEQKSGQQNVPTQQGERIQHLSSTSVIQKQPQEQQETQIRSIAINYVLLEEEEEINYKQLDLSLAKEVDKLKQELQQLRVYAETETQLSDQRDINFERELQDMRNMTQEKPRLQAITNDRIDDIQKMTSVLKNSNDLVPAVRQVLMEIEPIKL